MKIHSEKVKDEDDECTVFFIIKHFSYNGLRLKLTFIIIIANNKDDSNH
jgi:hypothetical protein